LPRADSSVHDEAASYVPWIEVPLDNSCPGRSIREERLVRDWQTPPCLHTDAAAPRRLGHRKLGRARESGANQWPPRRYACGCRNRFPGALARSSRAVGQPGHHGDDGFRTDLRRERQWEHRSRMCLCYVRRVRGGVYDCDASTWAPSDLFSARDQCRLAEGTAFGRSAWLSALHPARRESGPQAVDSGAEKLLNGADLGLTRP
jgi:hypothetical protein